MRFFALVFVISALLLGVAHAQPLRNKVEVVERPVGDDFVIELHAGSKTVFSTRLTHDPFAYCLSPDGTLLAVAEGYRGTISVYEVRTSKCLWRQEQGENYISQELHFSPDNRYLIGGGIKSTYHQDHHWSARFSARTGRSQ